MIPIEGMVSNLLYVVLIFTTRIYLQDVRHLSQLMAGVVFLACSFGAAIASPVSGRLGTTHPQWVLSAVFAYGGCSAVLLSFSSNWVEFVPTFSIAGFETGLGRAYAGVGTQAVVSPERAGGAALTILIAGGGVAIAAAAAIDHVAGEGAGEGTHSTRLVRWRHGQPDDGCCGSPVRQGQPPKFNGTVKPPQSPSISTR